MVKVIKEIKDNRFRVCLDLAASSPDPQVAIWRGQHTCVSETFAFEDEPPLSQRCGEIIIKHQLAGDRGHFSVLRKAFVSFCCTGFPHSVVAQITRHQDSSFLVQSNRWTGERFVKVSNGELDELDLEEVFYFRPEGIYFDRNGNKYEYTHSLRERDLQNCAIACVDYKRKIKEGCPFEMARDLLPYNVRQNFDISCDLQACWHWLDQRTKADSQLEIQALAKLVLVQLQSWCPQLTDWYLENRYAKAKLAP